MEWYCFPSQRLPFRITKMLSKVLAVFWDTWLRFVAIGSLSKQATFKHHVLQKRLYYLACEFKSFYQFKSWVGTICLHLEFFSKTNAMWDWVVDIRQLDKLLLSALHRARTIYVFLLSFVHMYNPLLQQLHIQHANYIILGRPVKLPV